MFLNMNMNSYKSVSFIIFLTAVVSQVVGDFGEYAKKNAYMLFNISLKPKWWPKSATEFSGKFFLFISKRKEKQHENKI